MLKALIINPGISACDMLRDYFDSSASKTTEVDQVSSLEEAEEILAYTKPDIIFLDLDMSLKEIADFLLFGRHYSASIIFTSDYNPNFEKAIRFCSMCYLPKHLNSESVEMAIRKCQERPMDTFQKTRLYQVLVSNLQERVVKNYHIAIVSCSNVFCFSPNDIVRFQAEQQDVVIHLEKNSILAPGYTLWHFEAILQPFNFIRCHKFHLINPLSIKGIARDNCFVTMSDGSCLELNRRMAGEVLRFLNSAKRKIVQSLPDLVLMGIFCN